MSWKENAKRAGAAVAIASTIASTPDQKLANTTSTNRQAKAQMRDRANEQAARLRTETGAKGNRTGGSGKSK